MIAEKAVLGTIIQENYLFSDSGLSPEHFAEAVHKNIFSAMKVLADQNRSMDVTGLLINSPDAKDIGGASYLSQLKEFANPVKFDEYCEVVLNNWKEVEKRKILQVALSEDWPQEEILQKLTQLETAKTDDLRSIDELLAEVVEDPFVKREVPKGTPAAIRDLDEMTSGWQDSDLIIVAARPSMGKTDVLLHLARHAGWANHLPIIFSLEMSAEKLRDRLIAVTGNYSRSKMRDPYEYLTDEQKEKWMPSLGRLGQTKIQIYEASGQTVPEMRAKVRKSMQTYPDRKPIIFIDYLTLIRSTEKMGNNHLEVGRITEDLKAMAKEFKCPVVCLAQLSRGVEQRQDKRPMMSDLRESGSIEETADVAIFLYRESYYDKETEDQNTMEMIVAKNRNGATGTVVVAYNKITGGIYNLDYADQH